ncbi:hypothetical protein N7501_011855 [Penicillium viridicatum]|nr:hypothetical protein N7501_011855 [Penicillium viridicatum]
MSLVSSPIISVSRLYLRTRRLIRQNHSLWKHTCIQPPSPFLVYFGSRSLLVIRYTNTRTFVPNLVLIRLYTATGIWLRGLYPI